MHPISVKNPYLEAVLATGYDPYSSTWYLMRKPGYNIEESMKAIEARWPLIAKYSYAIPDNAAIQVLVDHSPIIEIGAGLGYWASLVKDGGGEILATDRYPPPDPENPFYPNGVPYVTIYKGGPEVIEGYQDRTMFLCWPPMDDTAYDALRLYKGNTLIYVGEDVGGCTANEKFFELLGQEWEEKEVQRIPFWYGLHDALFLYKRKV